MRPLAIVTGASSGIGYELAHLCAEHGYDLSIAGDEFEIEEAAENLRTLGVDVEADCTHLATTDEVEDFLALSLGRPIELLIANAGFRQGVPHCGGSEFVHDTEVPWCGMIYLIEKIARSMRERRRGRILITASRSVDGGMHDFLDHFSQALRAELKDFGVAVTCLMPPGEANSEVTSARLQPTSRYSLTVLAQFEFDSMMSEQSVTQSWRN